MAQILYPRVEINTIAKRHSSVRPAPEDTTSILAMCIAEKGPTSLTAVHSLAEFKEIFGDLTYEFNGQNALNIYNWLSNGGTAYVKRFVSNDHAELVSYDDEENEGTAVAIFKSKYPGEYYEHLFIDVQKHALLNAGDEPRYTIAVIYQADKTNLTVEKYYRVLKSRVIDVLSSSELIKLESPEAFFETLGDGSAAASAVFKMADVAIDNPVTPIATSSTAPSELEARIQAYLSSEEAQAELSNKLLAPFELVLGAGYTKATDDAILGLTYAKKASDVPMRPDVVVILDDCTLGGKINPPLETNKYADESTGDHSAIFNQYFKIYDNIFTDSNIYVSTTYFLSSLIPYNDNLYGIQNAVAGLRRGVLEGALEIHDNLTSSEKNTLFKQRINYVEKTTREYAIMGNRTHDGSTEDYYTALSFLNNVRTLERMKKEIERMARSYLFEFNDAYTLSQLSSILNKYITEWILNRTLNLGNVTVEKDPYSDEQINIGLNIRFNGTVEVIHVDIVIE